MNSILIKLVDFIAWVLIACGALGGMIIALFMSGSEYIGGYGNALGYGIPWGRLMLFISSHPIQALFAAVVGFFVGLGSTAFFAGFWVLISNINKNMTQLVRLNHEQMKVQRLMCESVFSAENKSSNDKSSNSNLAPNLSASRDNE